MYKRSIHCLCFSVILVFDWIKISILHPELIKSTACLMLHWWSMLHQVIAALMRSVQVYKLHAVHLSLIFSSTENHFHMTADTFPCSLWSTFLSSNSLSALKPSFFKPSNGGKEKNSWCAIPITSTNESQLKTDYLPLPLLAAWPEQNWQSRDCF